MGMYIKGVEVHAKLIELADAIKVLPASDEVTKLSVLYGELEEQLAPHNENLSFGDAIAAAKAGHRIARSGWNGKNMFVVIMPELKLPPYNTQDTTRKVNDRTAKWIGEDQPLNCVPYFAMYAANDDWIPGWLASQTDMLSNDWMVIH